MNETISAPPVADIAAITTDPSDRYLAVADRIGRRLCRDAIWSGPACNWVGWSTELVGGAHVPAITALPAALYHGVAGVALFLAHLTALTGDRQQRATLNGCVTTLLMTDQPTDNDDIGYYTGRTGVAHVLAQIGQLTGDAALVAKAIAMLQTTAARSGDPSRVDVLSGCAGTIPALIDVAHRFGEDSLLELAIRQANSLVEWRHEDDAGVSWPSAIGTRNLTGYSHGAAGMGLALLEAFRVNGDRRLRETGIGAFRYERSLFDRTVENWPDFRVGLSGTESPRFAAAWCNGATGIGISRLRAAELISDDAELLHEAEAAMRTAIKALTAPQRPGAMDFSYCHGLAGHADYLLLISEQLKRVEFRSLADGLGTFGIETFDNPGLPWPCGVPNGGDTPALMLGTAGIGHFFLRLAAADKVPTVLIVRPQHRAALPG